MTTSGLHKKTIQQRLEYLGIDNFPHPITLPLADKLIENCIAVLGLPIGICPNLKINGIIYNVPMVTEEPSVVAASSAAQKLISLNGGFNAELCNNLVEAQISYPRSEYAFNILNLILDDITWVDKANQFCQRMVKRGGGVKRLELRQLPSFYVLHLIIDSCESMGANIANTVSEKFSNLINKEFNLESLACIVSNNTPRISQVEFNVPLDKLDYKGVKGCQLAQRIVMMNQWAREDLNRAITHNKGIMNGVVAVALATGQDTRAIEAACHAYASRSGKYQPLSEYSISNNNLIAKLSLPVCVGTKGGILQSDPIYSETIRIISPHLSSNQLACVMTCIGLGQNFAALRALVTEGIQRGHMHLHARNYAIAAGGSEHVDKIVEMMINRDEISLEAAKKALREI